MSTPQTARNRKWWQRKKRRLPLRLRLSLWIAGLILLLSFGLLFFINMVAFSTFPRIVRQNASISTGTTRPEGGGTVPSRSLSPFTQRFADRSLNPPEVSLLLELRSISLAGLGMVAVLGGAGAYLLSGIVLRPVRKVSEAARSISANTLDTRLALPGPRDEVKELADTFDAMLERLQQTFEMQGRFVADVAHELRTPLASLRTNLEVVVSDEEAAPDDYRAMIATQERALTRLERLMADLLVLTTSQQPLLSDEVTLGPLLEEVVDDLHHLAEARRVSVQLSNGEEVVVPGDAGLLARVFSNLLENAIAYNTSGGSVTISIEQQDMLAVVSVTDTGPGIAPENLPHIFERFYRVDSSRSRHSGGAGLGLSIVSALVHQHGGRVQAESTPGKGSTFTVQLPLSTS
ncbi:MAG TPA: ATP-binding protein [Ktedonobacteraceae bacterium]|nr:ATP-binding protein [Ktedonobacteraceae bacterium]